MIFLPQIPRALELQACVTTPSLLLRLFCFFFLLLSLLLILSFDGSPTTTVRIQNIYITPKIPWACVAESKWRHFFKSYSTLSKINKAGRSQKKENLLHACLIIRAIHNNSTRTTILHKGHRNLTQKCFCKDICPVIVCLDLD